jgi:hypothetical protein
MLLSANLNAMSARQIGSTIEVHAPTPFHPNSTEPSLFLSRASLSFCKGAPLSYHLTPPDTGAT